MGDAHHDGEPARCTSNRCPYCGSTDAITVERVVVGKHATDHCHCRMCGMSWITRDARDVAK